MSSVQKESDGLGDTGRCSVGQSDGCWYKGAPKHFEALGLMCSGAALEPT